MKKIFKSKRWIAFFLALLLIVTTCINSSDVFLWATGEDETSVSEQTDSGPAEDIVEMEVEEADSSETTDETDTGETDTDETGTDEAVAEETDGGETQDSTQDAEQEAGGNEGQVPEETEVPEDGITEDEITEDEITEDEITEEVPEIVEEAVTYGYAVYYYYDGVEDKGARVEKEGALGDSIFTTDAEKEVEHNGNNYVLDKVENKDGKVTEDAGKNVVKVYYVLKKEEVAKPAQTLTARASDGAKVTVEAPEGALPEGAKVTISVVKDSEVLKKFEKAAKERGTAGNEWKIYDITIWDAEGNEIQPDESVSVTISNTGLEGDGATVYHADDKNASVEKIAETEDANNAEFEAEHFSFYGLNAQGDEGQVYYYEEDIILGDRYPKDLANHMLVPELQGETYEWSVEGNSSVIEMTESPDLPVVSVLGVGLGEATVTGSSDNYTIIYHITVKLPAVSNPVYVYVKLDGMLENDDELSQDTIDKLNALGLEVNGHGWCTVGVIDGAQIDDPAQGAEVSEAQENEIIRKASAEEITFYTDKLDLSNVDWNKEDVSGNTFGVTLAHGADDYTEGKYTWHLNGYLDISKISYTIKYVDIDSGEEIGDQAVETVSGTELGKTIQLDEKYKKTIPGYDYVKSEPENEELTILPNNNVITLYYARQKTSVKIFKKAEKSKANAGDKIKYTVEVENTTSGRDLSDVVITDIMKNAAGQIEGIEEVEGITWTYDEETKTTTYTIENIPQAGNNQKNFVVITYYYTVPEEDMGETIINTVGVADSGIEIEEESIVEAEVNIATKELVVKAGNFTGIYNGQDQAGSNYFAEEEVGIPETELKGIPVKVDNKEYFVNGVSTEVVSPDGEKTAAKDAGTYINRIIVPNDVKVFDRWGHDVTKRFTVVGEDGTFTIRKKDVTLVSASLEKEYDGTLLNNGSAGSEGVAVFYKDGDNKKEIELLSNGLAGENGWVEGEGIDDINFTNSVRYPNETLPNEFEFKVNDKTNLDNYNVNVICGTLTITNRSAKYEVTLVTNSDNLEYNGAEQEVTGFKGVLGENATVNNDGGETTIEVKIKGQEYIISGLTASGKGTTVTGYPEEYGGYPVIASGTPVVKEKETGRDVSTQFNITYELGLLTINERVITIKAGSASYKYTGEEYKASDMEKPDEIITGTIVDGQFYKAEVSGSRKWVGESETKVEKVWIYDENENDVTSNYKITYLPGKIEVTDGTPEDEVDDELVINKDADGTKAYEVGDVVEFTISVTNIFDEEKTITLTEQPGVSFKETDGVDTANWLMRIWHKAKDAVSSANTKTITVGAKETVVVTAFYQITQDDILRGSFTNKVTVMLNNKLYDAEKEVKTEEPSSKITVTKSVTSITTVDGYPTVKPDLGDVIEYTIEVKNEGNLIMKDVVLKDELEGVEFTDFDDGKYNEEDGTITFETLRMNDHRKVTAAYTVTEEDIARGSVANVATATAKGPDDENPEVYDKDEVTTETEEAKGYIKLTKEVIDPKTEYALGAVVEYEIKAFNDGNVPVKNLIVEDELTGNTEGNNPLRYDGVIEPNETVTLGKVSYTVTEADIKNTQSKVKNIVTGKGVIEVIDPDTGKPEEKPATVIDGEADITIEKDRPSLSIIKTADMTSDVKPGDVITYTITVTNNGNVTINNVMAEDALLGKTGTNALIYQGTLAPGESKTFTETYTVTEKDILAGKVVNTATVKGENSAGGDDPEDETVVETPAAEIVVNYMVEKFVEGPEDEPQAEYKVGETIPYLIMVKNLGNVTLENVVVSDQLSNAAGEVTFTRVNDRPIEDQDSLAPGTRVTLNDDNTVTIAAIAPGEEVRLNCEYTVTRADAGNTIQNKAVVTADPVKPDDGDPIDPGSEETPEVPVNVESIYNLTIHYVYADGTMAAADYTGQYLAGEMYGPIYSPTVNGYISSTPFISSSEKGMPASDVELTVIYLAQTTPGGGGDGGDDTPDTPPAPDTPDTPPTLPVNPNPAITIPPTPVPAGGTPVVTVGGPALAALDDEAVPLGALIDVDEDGNVTVTPISEEEIPLAGGSNDDHKCCILHFLLMLAALIIYTWYTHSMKKHQKKLAEMKDELAEETLKKQLGITDGRQAEM